MNWLAMNGHGVFVWGSYALGLAILLWNLGAAAGARRAALRDIRQQLEEEQAE